ARPAAPSSSTPSSSSASSPPPQRTRGAASRCSRSRRRRPTTSCPSRSPRGGTSSSWFVEPRELLGYLPQPSLHVAVVGLAVRLLLLALGEILARRPLDVRRARQVDRRLGPLLGREEERGHQLDAVRQPALVVAAEAGRHHAGVEAVRRDALAVET